MKPSTASARNHVFDERGQLGRGADEIERARRVGTAAPRIESFTGRERGVAVALEHDVDAGEDGDVVGIASRSHRALTDLATTATRRLGIERVDEHQIGERSRDRQREVAAGVDGHDGMTLWRPRRDRRAAHTEEPPLEVDVVELVAIDVAAGRLVADHRVVLPAVPEAHDDVDRFFRLRVELGGRRRILAPEVRGFALRGRHRDLPSGTTEADVVERGHVLRDVERLGVRGGHRGHEPDRTGQRRDAREREQGVETATHAAAVSRLERERVVDGDEVEPAAFGKLYQIDEVLPFEQVLRARVTFAPRARVAAGAVEAHTEMELAQRGVRCRHRTSGAQLGVLAPNSSPSSGTDSNPSGPTGRSPTRVTRSTRRS